MHHHQIKKVKKTIVATFEIFAKKLTRQ